MAQSSGCSFVRPLAGLFLCFALHAAQATPKISWGEGPAVANLGAQAKIGLPSGCRFTDPAGTKTFLELTHNFPTGTEAGMIFHPEPRKDQKDQKDQSGSWFIIFDYRAVGFVKDDEKDKIDADALMKSMQEGTEKSNEERKKRGWPSLHILSWAKPPFYDPRTNNLTWGTLLRSEDGQESVNYTTRMLGRGGYMQVDLVTDPEHFAQVVPQYEKVMDKFEFSQGQKYAEFKPGDKLATIGLTALIAGGAGAVLVKSGLLGKLWKLIIPVVLAIGAFFKNLWAKLTGRKRQAF
jgi:uncharacterized membrane-anchored protein